MTDPVDTDALRNAAWEKYASLNGIHPHSIDRDTFNEGWDAAADEVDRLRLSDWNATTQRDRLADALRRSDNENDRLRAVIENAPHGRDTEGRQCELLWQEGFRRVDRCTCWKADAL